MSDSPKNLTECFEQLNTKISPNEIIELVNQPENKLYMYHHGLGRRIRNEWGLWGDSKLKLWFFSKGVWHPDDMSSIIIKSYWRLLNHQPIELNQQTSKYKEYWSKKKDVVLPKDFVDFHKKTEKETDVEEDFWSSLEEN